MRTILAAVLCAFCTEAYAIQCAPHDDFAALLTDQFGEVAQVQAVADDGRMMEIMANPTTGSWSALMTTPDGTACLVAAGERFTSAKAGEPA